MPDLDVTVIDTNTIHGNVDTVPVAIFVMTWNDGVQTAEVYPVLPDGEWGDALAAPAPLTVTDKVA